MRNVYSHFFYLHFQGLRLAFKLGFGLELDLEIVIE